MIIIDFYQRIKDPYSFSLALKITISSQIYTNALARIERFYFDYLKGLSLASNTLATYTPLFVKPLGLPIADCVTPLN